MTENRKQRAEGIKVGRGDAEGGNIEEAAFREGFVDGFYIIDPPEAVLKYSIFRYR